MPSKSQDLAKQILDGTLSFSNLEGCDAELSANQNPLIIKYNQLFLLRKDRSLKSPYLSYWPFFDFSVLNGKNRKAMAMATNILASIPVRKDIENNLLPDPNKKNRTLEKKNVLIQQKLIGSTQTLGANQIHAEYKKYIEQRVGNEARPIHRLYSQALRISLRDFTNASKLAQAIADELLDPFYSSSPAKYRYATFGLYEQVKAYGLLSR
jgi:hypothetical protein